MIKKNIIYSFVILLLVITLSNVSAQDNQKPNSSPMKTQPIPLSSFKHSDIGNPSIKGTVKVLNNGFDMTASGADIWGVKDEFNFIYVERTGDFDIVSRIESLTAAKCTQKPELWRVKILLQDAGIFISRCFLIITPEIKITVDMSSSIARRETMK